MRGNGHDADATRAARSTLGRSVGTWRRLYMLHGPRRIAHVANAFAERAYLADRALHSRPTQRELCAEFGVSARSIERNVAQLVASGWLARIGPRPCLGVAQTYRLALPASITQREIELARSLKPGMWRELSDLCTARRLASG